VAETVNSHSKKQKQSILKQSKKYKVMKNSLKITDFEIEKLNKEAQKVVRGGGGETSEEEKNNPIKNGGGGNG